MHRPHQRYIKIYILYISKSTFVRKKLGFEEAVMHVSVALTVHMNNNTAALLSLAGADVPALL